MKVFKICKNNRLCTLLAQLVCFEDLYQAFETDWSHFGEKSKKGVVILARVSVPSF